ncbi:response regulator [Planctomycetota bacterium]|nr:response regulator [Planctomycetota bacterium]
MKLSDLTPAHVKQAVSIFVEHAWPGGPTGRAAELTVAVDGASTMEDLAEIFELVRTGEGEGRRRFSLRLGNDRYPWMKLVVQEFLVSGEFFISADTHDDIRIDPTMPDYAAWIELRSYNGELKEAVEAHWERAGLPTHSDLRALCEGMARLEAGEPKETAGPRLLIVDDDEDVCCGEAAFLRARGYTVETAFDGRQTLERMGRDPLPDLVVLDFAMPEFDGEEVMRRLRADPRTAGVPLLLATASEIELPTIQRASGLLRKPYPREVLFEMIERLLGEARD